MKSSRQVAAEALLRVERGGYSQLTLDAALTKARLSVRDAAFCTALFYGVLERRLTLDHCIAAYARHPLSDTVAQILRLSFYQLLYLGSVPRHAAVDEGVNLTRAMGQARASGMVNGILRSFLRDGCRLPHVEGDATAHLMIEYSCGEAVVRRLLETYGEESAREILAASIGRPPLYIRVNPLKTDPDTLLSHLEKHGCAAKARLLDGNCLEMSGDPVHTVSHKLGYFHVQDYCSQQAALALEPPPGSRVLDCCAAPGSKSFVLAGLMEDRGEILACDAAAGRLSLVEAGAKRLGISCIATRAQDGTIYEPSLGLFDRVLCDVPCSGLGVLRRKPEIKYRDEEAFGGLPALQYKILETAANYLKRDGMLVYSTCTILPEENERVVSRFLREHPAFAPAPFGEDGWSSTHLPETGGGDGFFISRIRRVE